MYQLGAIQIDDNEYVYHIKQIKIKIINVLDVNKK